MKTKLSEKMSLLTEVESSAIVVDEPKQEVHISCTYTINGLEVTRMLTFFVKEEQFKQYQNTAISASL